MNVLIWTLSACVLILAVLLIRALFGRKLRPGFRYALWALVLVRLLIPGSLWTSPVSVGSAASGTRLARDLTVLEDVESLALAPDGSLTGTLRESGPFPARPAPSGDAPDRGTAPGVPAADSGEKQRVTIAENVTPRDFTRMSRTLTARRAARIVWIAGSAAVLAVFIVTNVSLYTRLGRRRRRLEADCPVRVYEVEGLESSCLFLNAIYVNSETAADGQKLRHVLAHELSHRRHGDGLWALLRCAALTVHWFDPLVWIAASASRQDSELFADAGALRRLGDGERESYGSTLISLSVHVPRAVSPLCAATAMSGGKKALRARVELIARSPRATLAVLLAAALIAGIAVGCTFAGTVSEGDDLPGQEDGAPADDGPGPEELTPNEEGDLPSDTGPDELPQTPNIGVFESAALNVALLYPAGWDDLCAMTETRLPEDYAPGGEEYVPCVAIALWGELLGLVSAPGDYVLGPAAAFVYWSHAGESGPEAESGESVTLYTAGDGSELRCYLPMTDKLNWSGVDAGPYAQRIYDAFDTIERDILDGKLACRSISALEELSSLLLEELFALYDGDGGYNEFVLVQLIDRFLAAPVPFLAALAEEPEAFREVFTARMGVSLSAWYFSEAQACFDGLAGESLDARQTELLDAVISAFEAERIRDTVEDYLRSFSTESMLYTDQDLRANTVLDGSCDTQSLPNGDDTSFELPGGVQTVAQMRKNIAFYEDKAEYWKGARQMENIYRGDMRLEYRFDEITVNADTAHVQVSEYASFTYTDSTAPSYAETVYTVDLVKIGDGWWIADINDVYDWFDARFKNTDFDVQAELNALRAQLEAE